MIVALIGNQNSGKTTLFNRLTGSNQKVGNFPGVTVSKKTAPLKRNAAFTVVDLPGIYSLSPYSSEEVVTRDFLLDEKPDVILNVLDTTHIERSLYLTLQLIELGIPMVVALNMMDEMISRGAHVHFDLLQRELGVPVVPISASKNEGIDELMECLVEVAEQRKLPANPDLCTGAAHRTLQAIMIFIEDHAEQAGMTPRFAATKICERDPLIQNRLRLSQNEIETCEHMIREMEDSTGLDNLAALAEMRYQFIDHLCSLAIHKASSEQDPRTVKLDRILTHRIWAIPIFAVFLGLTFYLSFSGPGAYLAEQFDHLIDRLIQGVDRLLGSLHTAPGVHSFVIDGVLAGVGSVMSFLPLIIVLFFLLSIMEDTGYMARIAFVMDASLRRIGLSGASIVPLIMGFGCSVPAFMATRTLPGRRDRLITTFLIPFMSCSAKVPIYGAITAIFFPKNAGLIMVSLYLFGILLAVLVGLILKLFHSFAEPVPFVMELPPYRFPSAKSVLRNLWEHVKEFFTRAFTIILLVTVVIWFLRSFDPGLHYVTDVNQSILARLGRIIAPAFALMGLTDWRAPAALISGLTAKEAVISTLAVLSGTTLDNLHLVIAEMFTPLSAYAFLVFVLIYTPCAAAVAAAKKELGSRRAVLLMVVGQTGLAWLIAVAVYQVGGLFKTAPLAAGLILSGVLALIVGLFLAAGRQRDKQLHRD